MDAAHTMSNHFHQAILSVVAVFLIDTALALGLLERGWPLYLAVPAVAGATLALAFITILLVLWMVPPDMRRAILRELDAEVRTSWGLVVSLLKKSD